MNREVFDILSLRMAPGTELEVCLPMIDASYDKLAVHTIEMHVKLSTCTINNEISETSLNHASGPG